MIGTPIFLAKYLTWEKNFNFNIGIQILILDIFLRIVENSYLVIVLSGT